MGLRQSGQFWHTAVLVVLHFFQSYIQQALKEAQITSKVGWHTSRHSFATILKSHGEDVKTVQELMRYANSSVTLNLTLRR